MQLEVGKRYVTRDGNVTSPLVRIPGLYPFQGVVGEKIDQDTWKEDGGYYSDGGYSEWDLVAEYKPKTEDVFPKASRLDLILDEIGAERARQDAKWGEQNHEPHRWLSILMEEVGEAAQAANDSWDHRKTLTEQAYKQECYREELVQVAAVTIAMIESLDRNGK